MKRSIWNQFWGKSTSTPSAKGQRAITEILEGRTLMSSSSTLAATIKADIKSDVDDHIAGAATIKVGMDVNAKIGYEVDVDLYKFKATKGDRLMFDIDLPKFSQLDSYMRIFDATGKEIAASDDDMAPDDLTGGMESYIDYTFNATNTYYVGISGAPNESYSALNGTGDQLGSTGSYTLHLTQFKDTDTNDQLTEAQTQNVGDRTYSNISSVTDVDMFKVTVKKGQTISFDVDLEPGSTLNAMLRLFDSNGRELATDYGTNSPGEAPVAGEAFIQYTFNQAGTFYIGVSGAPNAGYDPMTGLNDVAGSTGKYSLKTKVVPPITLM